MHTRNLRAFNSPGDTVIYHADLVLSSDRTSLTVKVLQKSKPAAGVYVRLTQEGNRSPLWTLPGDKRSAAADALQDRFSPTRITDAHGEARFTGLIPGEWTITAVQNGGRDALDAAQFTGELPLGPASVSRGVAITNGLPRRFVISLGENTCLPLVRIVGPNNNAPAPSSVQVSYTRSGPGPVAVYGNIPGAIQGANLAEMLPAPGLYLIDARYNPTDSQGNSTKSEPYYGASALVAVSDALTDTPPVVMHSFERDPGAVAVQLVGADGRPSAGSVTLERSFEQVQYAASLDANGRARFSDVPSGDYTVRVSCTGRSLPVLGGLDGRPLVADAALTDVNVLYPQAVTVKSGALSQATLKPQRMGYIRGAFSGEGGVSNYVIFIQNSSSLNMFDDDMPIPVTCDPRSGEFLAGPVSPGKAEVLAIRKGARNYDPQIFAANVEAGKVVHIDAVFTDHPEAAQANNEKALSTVEGLERLNPDVSIFGQVVQSNRTTPAYGAEVALVAPGVWEPVEEAWTDVLGRFRANEWSASAAGPSSPPSGSPSIPVLVSWLPGRAGATIVPYVSGRSVNLVLPPPVALHGRVTVDGKPTSGLAGGFEVLAAYQGKGKLGELLSVQALTQADGTFELPGLIPGLTWFRPPATASGSRRRRRSLLATSLFRTSRWISPVQELLRSCASWILITTELKILLSGVFGPLARSRIPSGQRR